jgi:hypothetical protein
MGLTSVTVIRITTEVTLSKPPASPDNLEEAAFRAEVAQDIQEIKDKGWIVEIPFELPEI